ncbi:MAG: hypothetical protein E7660_07695, partial [Ruminococcaceae bacterium]|nr:hypothetical protein [Oscillospiraceae bacterium]
MKNLKKALCAILAVMMLISCIPMSISAANDTLDLYYNTSTAVSSIKDKTSCSVTFDKSYEAAYVFANGAAPAVTLPVSGYADGMDYAVITTRVPVTNSAGASKGTVEFKSGNNTVVSKSLYWIRGYKFYSTTINVSELSSCDSIKINFFTDSEKGDTLRLYSVSFCKTAEEAAAKAEANEKAANGDILSMYTEGQLASKAYVQEDYTLPYWDTPIIYNENVYPLENPDGSIDDITLMYDIDRIVTVKNYELNVEYKEGVDYEIVDGKLRILQSGSIPTVDFNRHYFKYQAGGTYRLLHPFSGYTYVRFEEGFNIPRAQLAITYTHTDDWEGYIPPNQGEKLPRTKSILESGGNLDIVLFGDSITNGGNSSGNIGMLPYAEEWTKMFEAELKKTYPDADISVTNTSISGGAWDTAKNNVYNAITPYNPDLLVLALGVNDYQFQYSTSKVLGELDYVLNAVKEECPDTEIIIVAPMMSNPECFSPSLLNEYIEGYYQRAEWYGNAVVADVTQVHEYLLTRKNYTDMSANNLCHLNDFLARTYTHVILKTVIADKASEAFKAQNISRLDYITNKSLYFDAEVQQINSIIAEAKTAMNNALTCDEIRAIYTAAKTKICVIPRKFDVVCASTDFTNIIFDNELKASLFTGPHYVSSVFNAGESAIELTMTNSSDPYINLTYSDKYPTNADDNKYVVLTYKVPYSNSSAANNTQLYFCAGDVIAPASSCSYTFAPVKDGNYHSVIVDLTEASWWEGIIHKIRIDPFATCSAYDKMFVYSVSLAETETEAKKLATFNEENANHTYQSPSHTVVFTNESALDHASAPTTEKLAGDVDGNETINAKDAFLLKKYLRGTLDNSAYDIDALDVNRDEDITAADSIAYKKIIAGTTDPKTYEASPPP